MVVVRARVRVRVKSPDIWQRVGGSSRVRDSRVRFRDRVVVVVKVMVGVRRSAHTIHCLCLSVVLNSLFFF